MRSVVHKCVCACVVVENGWRNLTDCNLKDDLRLSLLWDWRVSTQLLFFSGFFLLPLFLFPNCASDFLCECVHVCCYYSLLLVAHVGYSCDCVFSSLNKKEQENQFSTVVVLRAKETTVVVNSFFFLREQTHC